MIKFILVIVLPAFLAFYFFSFCNGTFADAHNLHSAYVIAGYTFSAWVVGLIGYRFCIANKKS